MIRTLANFANQSHSYSLPVPKCPTASTTLVAARQTTTTVTTTTTNEMLMLRSDPLAAAESLILPDSTYQGMNTDEALLEMVRSATAFRTQIQWKKEILPQWNNLAVSDKRFNPNHTVASLRSLWRRLDQKIKPRFEELEINDGGQSDEQLDDKNEDQNTKEMQEENKQAALSSTYGLYKPTAFDNRPSIAETKAINLTNALAGETFSARELQLSMGIIC